MLRKSSLLLLLCLIFSVLSSCGKENPPTTMDPYADSRREAADLSGFYRGYLSPAEIGRARFPAELQISYKNVSESLGRATVFRPEIYGKFSHFSRSHMLKNFQTSELTNVEYKKHENKIRLQSRDGLTIDAEILLDGLEGLVYWKNEFIGHLQLRKKGDR